MFPTRMLQTAHHKMTGPMLLAMLGIGMLTSPALAQSGDSQTAEMRASAEAHERAGEYEACGQAYLEMYKRDPDAEGMDEIVYNAGVCFEAGKSVGFAIRMYEILERQFPRSRLAQRALVRRSAAYASVANYEQAARGYEQYARRYAGEKDAPAALSDAALYRQALGQDREAIANLEVFIRQYGRKLKHESAEALFRLAEIHQGSGDPRQAAEAYQRYIREAGKVGGADRLLIAHARLGEILWKQSCPSEGSGGACIRLERARSPGRKKQVPTQCGPNAPIGSIVQSRTRTLADEAEKHFQSALRLGQTVVDTIKDPQRKAEVSYWLGAARFYLLDERFEQFLALRFPTRLDLDGGAGSRKRFDEWMRSTEGQLEVLIASYENVTDMKGDAAPWAIAAWARAGRTLEHLAQLVRGAELPTRLRRSSRKDVDAYCRPLQDKAKPLEDVAFAAFALCLNLSTDLNAFDTNSQLCVDRLTLLRPAEFPAAAEVHGASDAVADILATAPLKTGTDAQ